MPPVSERRSHEEEPPESPLSVARLVAVKVMPLPIDTKEGELQKELRSEILLMRSFTHRNVTAPRRRPRTHTPMHPTARSRTSQPQQRLTLACKPLATPSR